MEKDKLPGAFFVKVAFAIAWVTFREITRDKVFYNIVLFALFLLGAGYLASQLSYGDPGRVVVDFGISAVNLSCTAIAIMLGASVLLKEFERRTVFVALAHPISRPNFVVGKFLGVAMVLFVNWLLLSLMLILIVQITGGAFHPVSQPAFLAALFLVYWESLIMAGIGILFSTFSTTSLSVIISVGFYLIGNNNSQLRLMADKAGSSPAKMILKGLAAIFPNLEYFSLGEKVTYGLPIPGDFVGFAVFYAVVLAGFLLLLSGVFLQKREV